MVQHSQDASLPAITFPHEYSGTQFRETCGYRGHQGSHTPQHVLSLLIDHCIRPISRCRSLRRVFRALRLLDLQPQATLHLHPHGHHSNHPPPSTLHHFSSAYMRCHTSSPGTSQLQISRQQRRISNPIPIIDWMFRWSWARAEILALVARWSRIGLEEGFSSQMDVLQTLALLAHSLSFELSCSPFLPICHPQLSLRDRLWPVQYPLDIYAHTPISPA